MVWAKELGMVPVNVHIFDWYEALQKGMADLILMHPSAIRSFKFYEVGSYIIDIPMSGGGHMNLVNKDKWNSLPQYIKDIWQELIPYHDEYFIKYTVANEVYSREFLEAEGIEFVKFPPEEEAKLFAATAPVWGEWIKEEEGYPGGKQAREFLRDQIAFRDKVTGKPFTLYSP
jgi:TRAP-type C4-dicarboxylate transport system substrate-binding protein